MGVLLGDGFMFCSCGEDRFFASSLEGGEVLFVCSSCAEVWEWPKDRSESSKRRALADHHKILARSRLRHRLAE